MKSQNEEEHIMQTAVEIGAKIARARKLKNLSQTELAGQMSVTSQAVGKWERGESMPDFITFEKLTYVLGVDLNYFGEGVPPVQPVIATEPMSVESSKAKANEKSDRDMSSGMWKDADFSGLTGFGNRFNFSNILDCKFINSNLSTLTLKGNNLKNNDFSGSDFSGSSINASTT
jgi:transcriptional regulator with XRE-family HTH domain